MAKKIEHAGFWLRFVAYLIDSTIVGTVSSIVIFPFIFVVGIMAGINQAANGVDSNGVVLIAQIIVTGIVILAEWIYYAKMESSKYQATLGKLALGLKVINSNGTKLSFKAATGRYFAKMISDLTLYIGYMMAGWTKNKQALHDIMLDVYVVKK